MKVIVTKNYDEMSAVAADMFKDALKAKKDTVLGLATGSTPEGMYANLVAAYNAGEIDFAEVKSINLDEYYPIKKSDDQSYDYFMRKHLFSHVNMKEENIHLPNGEAADANVEAAEYEKLIDAIGGADIQVLGIGRNGHIGFNEPSDEFTAGTYKVKLTDSTIEANKIYFESEDDVPKEAITMGVESIINAKEIILIAEGKAKAQAIHDMIKGEISPACPASILQKHNNVHIFIDKDAASLL